jgi:hypothetical protein
MIVCVPARFDPLHGRIGHLHGRQADNDPPISVLREVQRANNIGDYLTRDILGWLEGKSWTLLQEVSRAGYSSRFFLKFDNDEDGLLFKLTWGGI